MATHNINIDSQIVVQTAAQWAVDVTVYSDKRILVTSDILYTGTDQPRFKFGNGVDTWANLDYVPEGSGGTVTFPFYHNNNYTFPDSTSAKFSMITSVAAGVIYTLRPLPAGTLKAVYTQVGSNSTIASSEDCVLKLISNDGADSFTISSTFKLNANRVLYQEYTGFSQAITAGGAYIQIETPVMATNAGATTVRVDIEMEL